MIYLVCIFQEMFYVLTLLIFASLQFEIAEVLFFLLLFFLCLTFIRQGSEERQGSRGKRGMNPGCF